MIIKNLRRFNHEKRPGKITILICIAAIILFGQAYGFFNELAKIFIYEKIPEKYVADTQWNIGQFQLNQHNVD